MTFISYAQNLEDVMLWRALKNYRSGFYIDVGACDPDADSVTKAFYERGWRGINIEPVPSAFEKLSNARPRDINLQIAADAASGSKTLYSIDGGNGLSTTVKKYAEKYNAEERIVEELEVETRTLAQICAAFVNQDISFLKIDVEGGEKDVLTGADFNAFRPWIVVVESTEPNSTKPSHLEWEPILLNARYTFVYFDGLNRYYVADEKLELLGQAFSTPPNWFDHYETSTTANLRKANENIQEQLTRIDAIPFPSFIEGTVSVTEKVEKLIENHLFLSQKLSADEEVPSSTPEVVPTAPEPIEISRQVAELLLESDGLRRRIDDLKEESMSSQRAFGNSEREKMLIREELARLVDMNQRLAAENVTLKQEHEKLNAEADAYQQELYESSRHIGAMSKERSNMNATIASLEHHVRHYMAQHEAAQRECAGVQRECADVQRECADVQRQMAVQGDRYDALSRESSNLHRDIATLHAHIGAQDARIAALTAENARLDSHIAAILGSRSWRITAPLRNRSVFTSRGGKTHG